MSREDLAFVVVVLLVWWFVGLRTAVMVAGAWALYCCVTDKPLPLIGSRGVTVGGYYY